jgi:hypothetical protein
MKNVIIVLVILFLTNHSNLVSQPYYQLLKEGRHWIYTKMGAHDPPIYITHGFALSPQGDTSLFDRTYKKIYQQTLKLNDNSTAISNPKQITATHLYALMREDAVERKLYMLPLQDTFSMCQPTEHLLYDFSLQAGDTLNECVLENIYLPFMEELSRIDSVSPYTYSGLETRAFFMNGVFDNYGDLFEDTGIIFEGYGYERHGLINYGRQGPLVLFQYFCEGDSLDCELLSAVEAPEDVNESGITISPNPANDILRIQMDQDFQKESGLQILLMNATGNVNRRLDSNGFQIIETDVSDLPDGLYFIGIYGDSIRGMKKLIIAHQ